MRNHPSEGQLHASARVDRSHAGKKLHSVIRAVLTREDKRNLLARDAQSGKSFERRLAIRPRPDVVVVAIATVDLAKDQSDDEQPQRSTVAGSVGILAGDAFDSWPCARFRWHVWSGLARPGGGAANSHDNSAHIVVAACRRRRAEHTRRRRDLYSSLA